MIQGITAAGLASIFPAMSSTGSCTLPDFESALFAMLGVTAEPESPPTTPNPQPAQATKAAGKTAAPDPPAKSNGKRPADEKKPTADQETASVAVIVPLPIATPLPQVDGTRPKAQSTSAQTKPPDGARAQAAFTPSVSAASALSSAIAVEAASWPSVAPAPQLDVAVAKPDGNDSADSETKQTSAPVTELDKAPASAKPQANENIPHAAVATPHQQPATGQDPSAPATDQKLEKILDPVKAQFAQITALDPNTVAKAAADPSVEAPSLQAASSNPNASPVPVPQPAAQPQASAAPAQPVAINSPVVPVNLPARSGFEQAAGGKSGHNSSAGKFHPPAANPSSPDRPSKGKTSDAATPAETKPDAPNNDAVKAIDPAAASDPASPKAQPEVNVSDPLPPQAPRAEAMAQADGGDPSPKADASSTPAQNAPASSVPLPPEKPAEPLFSSAQLIEKVSQSELRLGMRTGEFGNIEIRTTFDHQQLRAEISSERGELGQALSAELPGFEQRLRERDVPLSTVVVHQASAGASGGFDRAPRQQQQPQQSVTPTNGSEAADAKPAATGTQPENWQPEGILDICI